MLMCVVGLFIWRWRYSGAVLLQEGKQDICCWRPPAAFFLLGNGRPATDQQLQLKLGNLHKNKLLGQLLV